MVHLSPRVPAPSPGESATVLGGRTGWRLAGSYLIAPIRAPGRPPARPRSRGPAVTPLSELPRSARRSPNACHGLNIVALSGRCGSGSFVCEGGVAGFCVEPPLNAVTSAQRGMFLMPCIDRCQDVALSSIACERSVLTPSQLHPTAGNGKGILGLPGYFGGR